ncbi:MAG: DUF3570 domain-containing protein, partial [Planctomycetota bacterium]
QRNATLSVELGTYFDTSEPVGGVPVGLGYVPAHPATKAVDGESDDKMVVDVLVGWTQVLTSRSLFKSNLVFGQDDGYITDPYKILSVVDPLTGEPVANVDQRYVSEHRPDSKTRWAWYTAYQHQLGEDVVRGSYRFYSDDWGISSHTVDAHYRWQATVAVFVEPHLRWYSQGQADFYHTSLREGENYDYASADYRLADMTAITLGLTVGYDINPTNQVRLTVEHYQQDADPSAVIGVQAQQDLKDELSVVMARVGYTAQW